MTRVDTPLLPRTAALEHSVWYLTKCYAVDSEGLPTVDWREAGAGPACALLAAAYEVSPVDVLVDAETLRLWSEPRDEFLVALCGRHAWQGEMGVVYMAHLRHMLEPECGPIPWEMLS